MENHYLTVENRERLTVSQVIEVDAFDENNIWANIDSGAIEISGERLNIEKLDLENGSMVVTGKIQCFCYVDKKIKERRGLLRVFRGKI